MVNFRFTGHAHEGKKYWHRAKEGKGFYAEISFKRVRTHEFGFVHLKRAGVNVCVLYGEMR